jgi:hypothetical protein
MKTYHVNILKRLVCSAAITGVALGLTSCVKIGARTLKADRFDYAEAISDSTQTQTLLAIVKLRYSEWPTFLEVEQIVGQYTFEQVASAKGIIKTPFSGDNDQGEFGYVGKFSERPAILYKPLRGSKYMKSMLSPAPIDSLLALIHTEWPANRIFETFVSGINGKRNTQLEQGKHLLPDEAFARFINICYEFQQKDALDVDVRTVLKPGLTPEAKPREITVSRLGFFPDRVPQDSRDELAAVKAEMGMNPGTNRYDVVWGAIPPSPNHLAMETRSMVGLMVILSSYVDVLESELEEGRVGRLRRLPKHTDAVLPPLMLVKSGSNAPSDAYATCKYRGRWFWIADTDLNSKRTFAYLSLLLTIGETDDKPGAQLVITTN